MSRMIVIPPSSDRSGAKIRVAAYCRVSTSHSDQENSYETQVRYFSSLYNGSQTEELVGIYADEGISGTSLSNRVSFVKMMQDCRKGKIDRIVTKSVSRFARNTKDCLVTVRELKDLGITVSFEKENIDTSRLSDEMMITIMGGLAQEESHSISNNVRWGFQKRMANGTLGHARVPYGYKSDKKTSMLIIDRKTARIVRRIFDMYINGCGANRIAHILNDEKIPSPTGISWNNITILKMIRQEKYIGDTLWQKTYSEFMGPYFQINRGQLPKYYIQNSHNAIIDRETFELANRVMKARTNKAKQKTESPFRQKIFCGKCGHNYGYANRKNTSCWMCSHRYNISEPCDNPDVYDTDLQNAFSALCDKLHAQGKPIFTRALEQLQLLEKMRQNGTVTTASLYEQIAEIKEQKHRLAELRTKGYVSDEKYAEMESDMDNRIVKLSVMIDKANEEKDPAFTELPMLSDLFAGFDGTEEYRLRILSEAVERITVLDKAITFELIGGMRFTERTDAYDT
ncbi:Site-specific DNA recombinase [Ruminococcus sp. YE71]|uniref:recombinase family protein n=1 Tax=unclassified Ruminococcus TaxID=2608920 RepID=UPI00088FA941|nr:MULTISPECIES: recombinase family protein [unclassified Ruminococcus]SDA29537.1 Site-specific DNA recombinase [Ruminococcus sp. YE78]SFW48452.1 Site-specific DNA recombinase [Ruminococcus sp. YE71]